MKCMNCGAELTSSVYCPKCGCDVSVQKQAIILSGIYYNQGLEKAQVRDLSGTIDQLKRSLKFNKLNIPARNLLGLVYFETGEVVAALSEWVISKNIQPEDNIAAEYIRILQQDANRLDVINQTIKKYNIALENCQKGNEDVALIQLKKVLAQNPKLIKGYHLLSLLYMHNGEYEKARKLLRKALQIDKTNTTTLRFLQEVDEETGKPTSFDRFQLGGSRKGGGDWEPGYIDHEIPQPGAAKGSGRMRFPLFNVFLGAAIGAAAIWFLFIPAFTRNVNRTANEKVARYSSDMAVYSAQIQTMNDQIEASRQTVETANEQIDSANKRSTNYENLIKAVNAMRNESYETAANALAQIDTAELSVEAKSVYDNVAAELETSLGDAYKKAGIEAFNSADYDTAVTRLEAAVGIAPEDYDVLNYLAHAYRMKGETEKADATFQKIIELFPDTQEAENARGYLSTNADHVEAEAVTVDTGNEGGNDEEEQYENEASNSGNDEEEDRRYDEDEDAGYDEERYSDEGGNGEDEQYDNEQYNNEDYEDEE